MTGVQTCALPIWARVNDLFAVLEHEQLRARGRWAEVQSPGGTFQALRPPVDVSDVDVVMGEVPSLGQHTAAVLEWLGMSAQGEAE